jgi:hypothetical protein
MLEDVRVAAIVGEDKLSLLGVQDDDVTLGDVALDGAMKSVEENDVVVSPLVVAEAVKESLDDALGAGDVLNSIVTPSVFTTVIDTGAAVGIVENVRFAAS